MNIPKTDHYVGRKFVRIAPSSTEEPSQWAVELDGSVLIRNYDVNLPDPTKDPLTDPTGLSLVQVSYAPGTTKLDFGTYNTDGSSNIASSITLTANEYTIATPEIDEIDPRGDHTPPVPDDPSADRVASGPSGP